MAYLPKIFFFTKEIVHLVQCGVFGWCFLVECLIVWPLVVFLSFFAPLNSTSLFYISRIFFQFSILSNNLSFLVSHKFLGRFFGFASLLLVCVMRTYEVLETWMDMAPLQSNQTRQRIMQSVMCIQYAQKHKDFLIQCALFEGMWQHRMCVRDNHSNTHTTRTHSSRHNQNGIEMKPTTVRL